MNSLRRVRLAADRSQLWLMKKTGIYFATISRIERGWLKPTEDQMKKIARALNVDASYIFPGEGNKGDKNEHKIS